MILWLIDILNDLSSRLFARIGIISFDIQLIYVFV